MAESPAHRFGQFLGNLLEELFLPELDTFCEKHALYLDKHGVRPCRKGKKATWIDTFGNSHDLDFVIEKGGSPTVQGRPLAFIEAAWRRYTKHSRNKAQEIQGAVLPLAEKFVWDAPFKGAVLAGNFTSGSLTQLRSLGFEIVHIGYDSLVADFAAEGVDIAFDESTPIAWFDAVLDQVASGGSTLIEALVARIRQTNRGQFDAFFLRLEAKLMRHIERLAIIPLFGDERSFETIREALEFVSNYGSDTEGSGTFKGFEVVVRYSNGDKVEGIFTDAGETARFLKYLSS